MSRVHCALDKASYVARSVFDYAHKRPCVAGNAAWDIMTVVFLIILANYNSELISTYGLTWNCKTWTLSRAWGVFNHAQRSSLFFFVIGAILFVGLICLIIRCVKRCKSSQSYFGTKRTHEDYIALIIVSVMNSVLLCMLIYFLSSPITISILIVAGIISATIVSKSD